MPRATEFIRVTVGDRVDLGFGKVIVVEPPPDSWPRDWQHGVLSGPDAPCVPAGERCGPHRASWPSGRRCVIGALWDSEQG